MYQPNDYLKKAVQSGDIRKVRGALVGIIQADPSFRTEELSNAIRYCKNNEMDPFEQLEDSELPINEDKSSWDIKYFSLAETYLHSNFTEKRLNHVKEVGQAVNIHKTGKANEDGIQENKKPSASGNPIPKDKMEKNERSRQVIVAIMGILLAALIALILSHV